MTQLDPSFVRPGEIAPPNSPAQSPSRVPTLVRSDDKPGFGVMSGGEKQASSTWQEKLQRKAPGFCSAQPLTSMLTSAEKCRELHINSPIYSTFSDRRGGRTAWSSRITVSGQSVAARYWYDGQYLYNAKEDAAEMALKVLSTSNRNISSQDQSRY